MKAIDRVAITVVRITGIAQVLLGLAFWTGRALTLIPAHMVVGSLFVISLWVLALRVGFTGRGWGLAVFVVAWGAGVLAFGMTQAQILPGTYHWTIRFLHLLVGLVAMGLADRLGRRLRGVRRGRVVVPSLRPA